MPKIDVPKKKKPTTTKGIINDWELDVSPNFQSNKLQIIVSKPNDPKIMASNISPLSNWWYVL